MRQKLKNTQRGITLVALVITIIVLLILAMVSIKIAFDGGLTTKAKEATERHIEETEKEAIQTGYAAYQISIAKGENVKIPQIEGAKDVVAVNDGWNVMFERNSYKLENDGTITKNSLNVETSDAPDELVSYLIGKNGKSLASIMDMNNMKFIDDPNTISDASTSILIYNLYAENSYYSDGAYVYLTYKNNKYKLKIGFEIQKNGDDLDPITRSVNKVVELQKSEGKKATYNGKQYVILYQYDDNTVEMISESTMGSLKLGSEDTEAKGNNDFEKAVYSYNNAIKRINDYCKSLYKDDKNVEVRSVGSNPENPYSENSTMYTDDFLKNYQLNYDGKSVNVNGILKSKDKNYMSDINRMIEANCLSASDEKSYYIASRGMEKSYDYGSNDEYWQNSFDIRFWNQEYSSADRCTLISCYYNNTGSQLVNGVNSQNAEYPVRPIIKVSIDKITIAE